MLHVATAVLVSKEQHAKQDPHSEGGTACCIAIRRVGAWRTRGPKDVRKGGGGMEPIRPRLGKVQRGHGRGISVCLANIAHEASLKRAHECGHFNLA